VLSSFMGGLGLGNALAGRWGGRLRTPVRAYAVVEVIVGITGLGLVVLLPAGSDLLAPLFRPFLDRPVPLNGLRLGLAFLMLMLPCTAMGATLPLLVKALRAQDPSFGRALGRLYGWNTLGGVVGALAVETLLVRQFGMRGSAVFAAGLNAAAAAGALWLVGRSPEPTEPEAPVPTRAVLSGRRRRSPRCVKGAPRRSSTCAGTSWASLSPSAC
jgi:predicted membrane-bound spermidine synthase